MPLFEKLPALPKGLRFASERRAVGGQRKVPPIEAAAIAAPTAGQRRKPYPSDLTDAHWALLEPRIPPQPPGPGRPRAVDMREVVNGILYVLRTGCPWEFLPHDLPPHSTVYYYFLQWREGAVMSQINDFL